MTPVGWICVGLLAWAVAAIALGLAVGRVIRLRDRGGPR